MRHEFACAERVQQLLLMKMLRDPHYQFIMKRAAEERLKNGTIFPHDKHQEPEEIVSQSTRHADNALFEFLNLIEGQK